MVQPRGAADVPVINKSDVKDLDSELPPIVFINDVLPTTEEEKVDKETHHGDSFLSSSSIGPRSMSSPDFLHQYQRPYDEERDWPLIEREEDEVDGAGNEQQQQPLQLNQDPNSQQQPVVEEQVRPCSMVAKVYATTLSTNEHLLPAANRCSVLFCVN